MLGSGAYSGEVEYRRCEVWRRIYTQDLYPGIEAITLNIDTPSILMLDPGLEMGLQDLGELSIVVVDFRCGKVSRSRRSRERTTVTIFTICKDETPCLVPLYRTEDGVVLCAALNYSPYQCITKKLDQCYRELPWSRLILKQRYHAWILT